MKRRTILSAKQQVSGFALLEALIGIMLIGVAFLAAAGLHIRSLRDTQLSTQIVTAALLSEDLSQRLRTVSTLKIDSVFGSPGRATVNCYMPAGCKPNEMAADEIGKWRATLLEMLPNGGGIICRDSSPDDGDASSNGCDASATAPVVIKVWWQLRDTNSSSKTPNYQRFTMPYVPKP